MLEQQIAERITAAGYASQEPVIVGIQQSSTTPSFVTQGLTSSGQPLTATTVTYTASLSKQITAACAVLLVQRGELDMATPLSRWLPELPSWAGTVRLRHLVGHTGALPADTTIDPAIAGADRTTHAVLDALTRFPGLEDPPGSDYAYSNAGYVCLAAVVERAAGQPLADFARQHLFVPLGMEATCYWPGPPPGPPGSAGLAPAQPAPLSLGDGGVWSSARDLMRWNQALATDTLGITALLHTPGRLADGTLLPYAWGVGIRTRAGHQLHSHGGSWPGMTAKLVRLPESGCGLVAIALADGIDRMVTLVDRVLDLLTANTRGSLTETIG